MYAIKMPHGMMSKTFAEFDDAKKEANGFLLSRSAERRVEIVQIIPGQSDLVWPVIWRGTRKSRGGPITWKEVRGGEPNR